ncbi:MAG TPA: hypothetical protein VF841_09750 [Anaeromyxobacter sp.]
MRTSRRVQVRSGETALAPRVDDPRGFALENQSGGPLTVSFRYDAERHVQTIVVEEPRPILRIPSTPADEQPV